ncbi:MAG TPA: TonB-dependent receptor [Steroidobacteraceae bacterium]|nr:TonB-dependent receptor [Steroidobacteraceae bacterium]
MSNSRNRNLQRAVHLALVTSALAAAGVASAQTAPSTAGAAVEEVVVTGSRIALAPNQVSISPVTQVSSADLQQSGATRVEDMLNQMPQVFAAQGSTLSNGADGTATIDLRNLGSQRTLVLVNGRRLGPGDPRNASASDVNQIPAALIDSVEILTGGASSVYGADAVAGVVNFKLNDHFEGVKLVTNYAFNNHHQDNAGLSGTVLQAHNDTFGTSFAPAPSNVNTGFTKDLSLILGMNTGDGKGNATAYVTYRNVAAVLQSKYDYSACTFASGWATYAYPAGKGTFDCGGSSTSYPGRFLQYTAATGGSPIGGSKTLGPNGTLIPFTNAYRYNYGPLNFYQRPDERWMAGSFAHYEFSEHANVYTEIQFMDDHSVSQIAPSGAFFGAPFTVNCANPYLSAPMLTAWCGGATTGNTYLAIGRRNVEGGGRTDDLTHQSFRAVVGVKGKINDGWSYDIYGQYGSTTLAETYLDMSKNRINQALNVVMQGGQAVCADPNAQAQGCVPWNIFQPGGVTPAAVNYVNVPLIQTGRLNQYVANANVNGDLGRYGVQLPTAQSGMKVNIGAEWRDVTSNALPDLEFQTFDGAGQGGPILPISGGLISREVFAEMNLPLVDGKPGAQVLAFDAGYRYSDYSLGFKTNTYKFGLEWSPVNDVRLRGSFARAVRAPNVGELYTAQSVGLDGNTDPCAGAAPSFTAAQCALMGVTAAQYGNIIPNSASQYNGLTGGNPQVQPETAITKSVGIGWTPSFIPNFRAQIDWYDINIGNIIAPIGADVILQLCGNQGLYCNLVHRDNNGSLWLSSDGYVNDSLNNGANKQQKGIDFDLSYTASLGSAGKLRTNFNGTYIISAIYTPVAAIPSTSFDCAGYYGLNCITPTQRWRHVMRMTWQTPWKGSDVSLAWRYYGPVKLDQLAANDNIRAGGGTNEELIANGVVSSTDAYLSSRSYLDLTGSMDLGDHAQLRLGINNLLDKSPPVIGTTNLPGTYGNGNTFPQVYDSLGRYIFAELTIQF